jgi:hypothetical protein
VHNVSLEGGIYFRPGNIRAGMIRIRQDLEEQNTDLKLTMELRWLLSPRAIEESIKTVGRKASTITIIVKWNERADEMVARGIQMGGKRLRVERYINSGPDTICGNCAR